MQLSLTDYIVIAVYFCIILYIGFFLSRKQAKGESAVEDYLLAGRKLSLPIFIGTLVATWYGSILGIGEFVYRSGLVAWLCFCFPYYIAAALFAYFIAGKIRESSSKTIPEQIASKYGIKSSITASVIVLVITVPASYVLMLGVLLQMFTGWALWLSITAGAFISLVYLYNGGFRADVLTNSAQFVLMYIGFGALLIFSILKFGMPAEALNTSGNILPESHLSLTGNYSWQIIAVWFIISLQTFIDPSFHQRCAAAKTPSTARRGIFLSVLFWMIFDFMTITTAMYARAYFPVENPLMAYPAMAAEVLPVFWRGLFITALLATVMSTLDSYAFISGATIGNDILAPFLKKIRQKKRDRFTSYSEKNDKSKCHCEEQSDEAISDQFSIFKGKLYGQSSPRTKQRSNIFKLNKFFSFLKKHNAGSEIEKLSKYGLIISSAAAVFLAAALPSAVDLIYKTSSVAVPGLLIPLTISYSKRYKLKNAFIIMAVSSSVSLLWTALSLLAQSRIFYMREAFLNIEPMLAGLLASVLLSIFNIRRIKP